MKVLVCGGRDFGHTKEEEDRICQVLDALPWKNLEVISGMARGADSVAARWARQHDVSLRPFYAEWDIYGKSAGMRRNYEMIEKGQPDLVIAFPGGRGTDHMVRIA